MRKRADIVLVERGLFEAAPTRRRRSRPGSSRSRACPAQGFRARRAAARIEARAPHRWPRAAASSSNTGSTPSASIRRASVCLDVGASTGGFTDVLLRRGARQVYCRRCRPRPIAPAAAPRDRSRRRWKEPTRARWSPAMFAAPPELIVCDVSFISLKLVLPHVLRARRAPMPARRSDQAAIRGGARRTRRRASCAIGARRARSAATSPPRREPRLASRRPRRFADRRRRRQSRIPDRRAARR